LSSTNGPWHKPGGRSKLLERVPYSTPSTDARTLVPSKVSAAHVDVKILIASAVSVTILARRRTHGPNRAVEGWAVERDKAAQQMNALDTAIRALSGLNSTGAARGRGTMSAAARARISASQKARWARTRGQKVVSIAPKRHISAAGLARIRAAQRARWAKIKRRS